MTVIFEHADKQKKKALSTGFDFVGFISPLLLGIPLLLRRQWTLAIVCFLSIFICIATAKVASEVIRGTLVGSNATYVISYDVPYEDPVTGEVKLTSHEDAMVTVRIISVIIALFVLIGIMVTAGLVGRKGQAKALLNAGWQIPNRQDPTVQAALLKWGV
ncbi:hypothetical protein RYZ26_18360 [Terasakiella sp. A23]|uniref:hypothetical protein n=1 Tax=Terasakiella sp. FCG-A23 TaxID=3080561 RepID=UPI00295383A7|nr:hypothetical protein [Terasakiella sp. A23]MDV7341574.1 hypothetical protein [Terasakiella sp. A23]